MTKLFCLAANCSVEVQGYGYIVDPDAEPKYGFVKLNRVVVWASSLRGTLDNYRGVSTVLVDAFNCSALDVRTFDTYDSNADAAAELIRYLQLAIDDGDVVVAVTADEPTTNLGDDARTSLLLQFGVDVTDLQYRGAFAAVLQKGSPAKTVLRKVLTEQESETTQPHLHVTVTGSFVRSFGAALGS